MVRREHAEGYVCGAGLCGTVQSLCPAHISRRNLSLAVPAVPDWALPLLRGMGLPSFLPHDEKKTYFVALRCWLLVGTEGTPHHTRGFVRDRWLQEAHQLDIRINAVLIKLIFLPMWAWGREGAQNQNPIFFSTCGVFSCSFFSPPPPLCDLISFFCRSHLCS